MRSHPEGQECKIGGSDIRVTTKTEYNNVSHLCNKTEAVKENYAKVMYKMNHNCV